MKRANGEELRVLTTFFRTAARHIGIYDGKQVDQSHPVFQTNLEVLRGLIKKKVNLKALEDKCRFCLREKRQLANIGDVAPELLEAANSEGLDRNLLRAGETYLHRQLRITQMPVTKLAFGGSGESDVTEGIIKVSQVESYTVEDLIEFYCTRLQQHFTKVRARLMLGAFNYLLANYDVDTVLFAIDIAADDANLRVTSPLDLQKYMIYADDEVKDRRGRA